MGNGLMAILAGLLGHILVETLALGPVAPFDAAALVLLVGGALVLFTWPENYGDSTHTTSALESFRQAAAHIANGKQQLQRLSGPGARLHCCELADLLIFLLLLPPVSQLAHLCI